MRVSRSSLIGVLGVLFCILGLWAGHMFGWLEIPNGLVYDLFVRLTPEKRVASNQVLLIEVPETKIQAEDGMWLRLSTALQEMGAAQIVYTFIPRQAGPDLFRQAHAQENVLFGRQLRPQRSGTAMALEPLPPAGQGFAQLFSPTHVPAPEYGIFRLHHRFIRHQGSRAASLVYLAAKQRASSPLSGEDPYVVNFNGHKQDLPQISLNQALSRQLVPELVQGKSVLIGPGRSGTGLQTPVHPSGPGMSRLQYLGLALDTLLAEAEIHRAGPWVTLVCIIGVAALGLIGYQVLSLSLALWFTLGSLLVYLGLTWALLSFMCLWPPIVEIILAQGLVFVLIVRRRQVLEAETLDKVQSMLLNRRKAYVLPEDFIASTQHWNHLLTMVTQTLNLTRSIFLEPVPNDHRVKEIVAFNCSVQDIKERRRDYERTPYTTALAADGPIQVEGYLIPGEVEEIQFLVPLVFADQVLGFWAFALDPQEYAALVSFQSTVQNYARQIAEMLYQRNKWQEEEQRLSRRWVQLVQLRAGQMTSREIYASYTFVDKKLRVLESVLQGLKTSVLVYDLFGRVMHINHKMERVLQDMQIRPFELTAAELAAELAHSDLAETKNRLNKVVSQQQSTTMNVLSRASTQCILYMAPLQAPDQSTGDIDLSQPFHILGILFELVEVAELQDVCNLKEDIMEDLQREQSQLIHSLETCLTQNEEKEVEPEEAKTCLPSMQTLNELTHKEALYTHIAENVYTQGQDVVPILARSSLHQAVQDLYREAAVRGISIHIQAPETSILVFAQPDVLSSLFQAILSVLIQDAAENTQVEVQMSKDEMYLVFTLSNQGFGLPEETFQAYLFSSQAKASAEFVRIKELLPSLKSFGGELTGSSGVGQGMTFHVRLKALH